MKTVSAAGRCFDGTTPVMQWMARAADRDHIIERALERRLPIALAPGQRGEAEFRRLRRVDAKLRQAMPLKLRLHRRRRRCHREIAIRRR